MQGMAAPNNKALRRKKLRDAIWKSIEAKDVWHSVPSGFAMVPRVMPLLFLVMDRLSVGKPVSAVYFDLWCASYEESFIEIGEPRQRAFSCDFHGPRAVSTWNARMKVLKEIGFIDAKRGAISDYQYVLIRHPYRVLMALREQGRVEDDLFLEIHARAAAVGVDLDATIVVDEETGGPAPAR